MIYDQIEHWMLKKKKKFINHDVERLDRIIRYRKKKSAAYFIKSAAKVRTDIKEGP